MKKNLSTILILVGLICVVALQKKHISSVNASFALNRKALDQEAAINSERIDGERIRNLKSLPNLGFRNFFANWVFLRFLTYFGDDELRNQTGYGLSPDFFEVILDLDPHYRPFYLFTSSSTTMYAGKPSRTVTLLSQGLNQLEPSTPPTDSFFIWRYRATDELLFLNQNSSAEKSYQISADWADLSDHPQAKITAEISRRMVLSLQKNPDNQSVKRNAWLNLLNSAIDDGSRRRIIEELRTLGGDIDVDATTGLTTITLPNN